MSISDRSIIRKEIRLLLIFFQKHNAKANDDVELGVIVPEGSSEECRSDVECQNKPGACHSEVSIEDTSEGRTFCVRPEDLRHIDSEDDLGRRGGEVRGAGWWVPTAPL